MSLRELLKDVALEDKAISQSAFRLVQGLVEAVEAIGVDKHIASLAYIHTELAEAKTTLERLRRRQLTCDDCLRSDRTELAKANAQIERLRKERNDYRADLAEELRRRECLILAKVAACDAEEAMRADAEISRLVRGMRFDSRLSRGAMKYRSEYWQNHAWWKDGSWYADPAAALRSIQEASDDEA